jgi:mRNA deadenylase 3'-5' endonuclease subunit Ccr4
MMEEDFIDFWSMKDIKYESEEQNTQEIMNIERKYPDFTTFKYRKKEGGFIQRTIDYMFCSI